MKLKRLLPTLLLILLTYSFSYSQKMVKDGHQWNVKFTSHSGPQVITYLTKISGDTTINETLYHKLHYTQDTFDTNWMLEDQFIREDSVGRVYTKRSNQENEILLYDFSLELNDTFDIVDWDCYLTVNKIDSTTINNGEKRKRISFKVSWSDSDFGPVWIEGIGNIGGGLYGDIGYCVADVGGGLLCFSDDNEILYPESPLTCFTSNVSSDDNAVQNTLPPDIDIYPNPISETLHISSGATKIKSFKIIDFMGRVVFDKDYTEESINVSSISSGTYIIVLENQNGDLYSDRLVKLD